MLSDDQIADLDAAGTLAAVEARTLAQRAGEVEELKLVLNWAAIHSEDPQVQPGAVPVSMGGDRLVQFGGDGTPKASELCWAELAIARGVGVVAMENYAADALDLLYRFPLCWEAVTDLVLPVWVARKVAAMSRKLSMEAAELVDAAVAAAVGQSPGRILSVAEAKVIEADLDAHRARLAADAAKVGVRLSQPKPGSAVDETEGQPGTRSVHLKLPVGAALDFDATVDEIADALEQELASQDGGCTLTRGELEAKAVELLSNPHAAAAFLDGINGDIVPPEQDPHAPEDTDGDADGEPEPAVPVKKSKKKLPATLHVHLTDLVLAGLVPGVARVEGIGPMLLEQLQELLGTREVTVQPVIDLNANHSVNGYEFPTLVKSRTLLRMLGDVFPHSANQGYRRLDHDHATPYVPPEKGGPPGQTGDHNDAPLTRRHHREKTHLAYDLTQLGLGTYRWVTPHGLGRLVTPAGTRRFTPLRGRDGHTTGELYYADQPQDIP